MFWKRWIQVGWALTVLMGVFMADAAAVGPGAIDFATRMLFGGTDPGIVTAGTRFAWGIGGGVCLGWAVMGFVLTRHAWEQAWARRAILWSGLAWLSADSMASVMVGAPLNAIVNAVFFGACFGLPLYMSRATSPEAQPAA